MSWPSYTISLALMAFGPFLCCGQELPSDSPQAGGSMPSEQSDNQEKVDPAAEVQSSDGDLRAEEDRNHRREWGGGRERGGRGHRARFSHGERMPAELRAQLGAAMKRASEEDVELQSSLERLSELHSRQRQILHSALEERGVLAEWEEVENWRRQAWQNRRRGDQKQRERGEQSEQHSRADSERGQAPISRERMGQFRQILREVSEGPEMREVTEQMRPTMQRHRQILRAWFEREEPKLLIQYEAWREQNGEAEQAEEDKEASASDISRQED